MLRTPDRELDYVSPTRCKYWWEEQITLADAILTKFKVNEHGQVCSPNGDTYRKYVSDAYNRWIEEQLLQ